MFWQIDIVKLFIKTKKKSHIKPHGAFSMHVWFTTHTIPHVFPFLFTSNKKKIMSSRRIELKMSKPLPKDRDCWYRYMYEQDKDVKLKKDEFLDPRLNVIRCDPLIDVKVDVENARGTVSLSHIFVPLITHTHTHSTQRAILTI